MSDDEAPARSSPDGRDAVDRLMTENVPVVVTELLSRVLAIKEGETFCYSDTEGNLDDRPGFGLGLYSRDTRFLSHFKMQISGRDPILLSSSAERAYMCYIDVTNPDLYEEDNLAVPQQTLNIRRMRAIAGRVYERIRIKNYNSFPVALDVDLEFGADFSDIFEVRGLSRDISGHYDPPRVEDRAAEFSYLGLDDIRRTTRIEFAHRPARLEVRGDLIEASFRVHLAAHETKLVSMTMETRVGDIPLAEKEFDAAVHELRRSYEDWERGCT